jgi:hypothetical protein
LVGVAFSSELNQDYFAGTLTDNSYLTNAIGTLIGYSDPFGTGTTTINNSFSTATINGSGSPGNVGGLVEQQTDDLFSQVSQPIYPNCVG